MAKKVVCVVFRQVTFVGGQIVQVPIAAFRDRSDAEKAGHEDMARLFELAGPQATRAVLGRAGIQGVTHGYVEMEMVEGAGLVLVGADALPLGGVKS